MSGFQRILRRLNLRSRDHRATGPVASPEAPERAAPEEAPPTQAGSGIALQPEALRAGAPRAMNMALLGTCIAEAIATQADSMGHKADHFLMQSRPGDEPPAVAWQSYDCVVVHLTLRQVLWEAASARPDLIHACALTDEEYNNALAAACAHLRNVVEKIEAAVGGVVPTFYFAFVEPPSTYQGILLNGRRKSLHHMVRTLNDELAALLEARGTSRYIEVNDLLGYHGLAAVSDIYSNHFSHAFFHGEAIRSVMTRVSDALTVLRNESPIKLIVTDLDNTLWKGVLAEFDDIVPHEHTEGWPLGYVEALLEFKRRGGLLAISSKNDHAETVERIRHVYSDRLSVDDFCSLKINWEPKSKNIREILAETNLLPGNVLFVDDNPREIEEVTRAIPELRTLSGDQAEWRNAILFSPHTQVARISSESAARTELIQAKQKRDGLATAMSRDDYLASLEIRTRFDVIASASHPKFARALELVNKTNQFNTTGKRWTHAEMEALFASEGRVVTVNAADRFGDNGLIAVALLRGATIEQAVMSCRVFGMGIETALLCTLFEHVPSGAAGLAALYAETGKNKACASFYPDHGFAADGHGAWVASSPPAWPAWITDASQAAVA